MISFSLASCADINSSGVGRSQRKSSAFGQLRSTESLPVALEQKRFTNPVDSMRLVRIHFLQTMSFHTIVSLRTQKLFTLSETEATMLHAIQHVVLEFTFAVARAPVPFISCGTLWQNWF